MAKNTHIGSSLDDLLESQGERIETNTLAIKRVIAWEISEMMKEQKLSKTRMAELMRTSRAALDRLLDPENTSVTLNTLDNAARAVGKKLSIDLVAV